MSDRAGPRAAQAAPRTASWVGWLPLADFFHLDTRALALFRIGIALLLLWDYTGRLGDLHAHYTDDGTLPRSMMDGSQLPISIHMLSGSAWWQALLMGAGMALAVLLLVGYRTRYVMFLSWFLLLSLHGRNLYVLSGGDSLLRLQMFWALFLPLGARFSLDAVGKEKAPDRVVSVASAAFIWQLCLVYLFSACLKWGPAWRTERSAVWISLNVEHLTTRFGLWLLHYPRFLRLLTDATMVLETFGPVMLFVPFAPALLRTGVVISFILFHVGLGLSMALGLFPAICIVCWLALLPTAFWDRLGAWLTTPARAKLLVLFDPRAAGRVAYLRTFLALPAGRFEPAQGGPVLTAGPRGSAWAVVDHEGKNHYGLDALTYLLRLSPVWRPLGWLIARAPARRLAERLYVRGASRPLPAKPPAPPAGPPLVAPLGAVPATIVVFCILYVTAWNVRGLYADIYLPPGEPEPPLRQYSRDMQPHFPRSIDTLGRALGLDQLWNLFAPSPARFKGWWAVVGTKENGSKVDLFRGGKPVTGPLEEDRPPLISATYPNGNWRNYMMILGFDRPGGLLRVPYAQYQSRRWNARHGPGERLKQIDMWYIEEKVNDDLTTAPARRTHRLEARCNDQGDLQSGRLFVDGWEGQLHLGADGKLVINEWYWRDSQGRITHRFSSPQPPPFIPTPAKP